jgi:ferredoxin
VSLLHSVRLDDELCRGCTNCLKTCPTEAIRVKKAHSDSLSIVEGYDFTIALPAPALYGQFPKGRSPDDILEGLVHLGFDQCVEVAFAAEAVSRATRAFRTAYSGEGPLISSSCPAVVRLLRNRFPDLLDQIIPLKSPMEIAARLARKRFAKADGRLGIFFISPCAAKVTATRDPLGDLDSSVDGVIGFNEIWLPLKEAVAEVVKESSAGVKPPRRSEAGFRGVSWARAEGAGDPLSVENPYLARARIRAIEEEPRKIDTLTPGVAAPVEAMGWRYDSSTGDIDLEFSSDIEPMPVFSLDSDYEKAVRMMADMDVLTEKLPGLDCGSCGSPSCHSLAEDIVRGFARETDCVFRLRDRIRDLTEEMLKFEEIVPPGMDKK